MQPFPLLKIKITANFLAKRPAASTARATASFSLEPLSLRIVVLWFEELFPLAWMYVSCLVSVEAYCQQNVKL